MNQAWAQHQLSQMAQMETRRVLDTVSNDFEDEDAFGWQQVVIRHRPVIFQDGETQAGLEQMRAALDLLFEPIFLPGTTFDLSAGYCEEVVLRAS